MSYDSPAFVNDTARVRPHVLELRRAAQRARNDGSIDHGLVRRRTAETFPSGPRHQLPRFDPGAPSVTLLE
jgi:hypothetical protein